MTHDRGAHTLATFPAELAAWPHVVAVLLREHADDGRGRCRTCSTGGRVGQASWPCPLRVMAVRARELIISSTEAARVS